jgi:hypothetical protein
LYIKPCIRRTVIILNLTGTRIDIAQTGYCALCVAAKVEYNTHRVVDKPPIAGKYVQLNVEACIRITVAILDLTGTRFDIA